MMVLSPPPHDVIREIASTATMHPNSLLHLRFLTPQKTRASTGGSVNGKPRNCGGLSFDSIVVVIVTTTGIAEPPDVRVTVVGLTLQDAPTTVCVGLNKLMLGTQLIAAVPLNPDALRLRL